MSVDGFLLFSDTGRRYLSEHLNAKAKISIFIMSNQSVYFILLAYLNDISRLDSISKINSVASWNSILSTVIL